MAVVIKRLMKTYWKIMCTEEENDKNKKNLLWPLQFQFSQLLKNYLGHDSKIFKRSASVD